MSHHKTSLQFDSVDTVEYSRDLLSQIEKAPTFIEKLQHLIIMYKHFYDEPRLLTDYEHFRSITWTKMEEQEVTLLAKLQKLPVEDDCENNQCNLRDSIRHVLILIGLLRMKYW